MTRTYLDHNATSPIRPEVIEAVSAAMAVEGNPSAQHADGRAANRLISDAREAVGLAMGVCAQDVIFNGGGSEGLNTAIHSAVRGGCQYLIVSSLDHPATIMSAEASGAKVIMLPATQSGQTDLDALEVLLKDWDMSDGRPFLSLVAANSETGVIQNTDRAINLVHAAGGLVLIDAVQALGKLPMSYPADYVAVSAHKIGGPMGVGALYVSPDAPFSSLINGGGQERRRRAGTLNVPGISGFGVAVNTIGEGFAKLEGLRSKMEEVMLGIDPETIFFGKDSVRLANTSFFTAPGLKAQTAMMNFDLKGVSVSTGTACSSGKVGQSRAVEAMGRTDEAPHGAIRVSLGPDTSWEDVTIFLHHWEGLRLDWKARSQSTKAIA